MYYVLFVDWTVCGLLWLWFTCTVLVCCVCDLCCMCAWFLYVYIDVKYPVLAYAAFVSCCMGGTVTCICDRCKKHSLFIACLWLYFCFLQMSFCICFNCVPDLLFLNICMTCKIFLWRANFACVKEILTKKFLTPLKIRKKSFLRLHVKYKCVPVTQLFDAFSAYSLV